MLLFQRFTRHLIGLSLFSLNACTFLPEQTDVTQVAPSTSRIVSTNQTDIGQTIHTLIQQHPGISGTHLLIEGIDALKARTDLIQRSESSIDLHCELFRSDETGQLMAAYLQQAADKGVRIRLLLDDLDQSGTKTWLAGLHSHRNIEIRIFNPFDANTFYNHSLHREHPLQNTRTLPKTFNVDQQIAIVGERNIGNDYFDGVSAVSWNDLDALVIGPVINDIGQTFDDYWNSNLAYPVDHLLTHDSHEANRESVAAASTPSSNERSQSTETPLSTATQQNNATQLKTVAQKLQSRAQETLPLNVADYWAWGEVKLLIDSPASTTPPSDTLASRFHEALLDETSAWTFLSPDFAPGMQGTVLLTQAAAQHPVQVITRSTENRLIERIHTNYQKYRKTLLKAGIKLYERKPVLKHSATTQAQPAFTPRHTHTYIVGERYLLIGSLNMPTQSTDITGEVGLFVDQPELALRVEERIKETLTEQTYQLTLSPAEDVQWLETADFGMITHIVDPGTSFWQRLDDRVHGWFSMEPRL